MPGESPSCPSSSTRFISAMPISMCWPVVGRPSIQRLVALGFVRPARRPCPQTPTLLMKPPRFVETETSGATVTRRSRRPSTRVSSSSVRPKAAIGGAALFLVQFGCVVLRPHVARSVARRGRCRAPRHGRAGCLVIDQPRRLHQQDGRLGAGRRARVRRDEDSPLKWRVGPTGQHIEMGIAEMNLVLLLGQLGLTWDFQRERLFPIGTLYDPFVMRALEGIVYSTYSGSRFVLAGTPSGISLSREGGAHQSLSTPGIGIETPGLTYAEPCFARELEWLLLEARPHADPGGEALYLRLSTTRSTRPVHRRGRAGRRGAAPRGRRRRWVPAPRGRRGRRPRAARRLRRDRARPSRPRGCSDEEGVEATVLCLSSPDRLYRDWQASRTAPLQGGPVTASPPRAPAHSRRARSGRHRHRRRQPCTSVRRQRARRPLRRARRRPFGQTGSQPEVYAEYGIDAPSIATAALVALEPTVEHASV